MKNRSKNPRPGQAARANRRSGLSARLGTSPKGKRGQRGDFYGRVLRRYFGGAA